MPMMPSKNARETGEAASLMFALGWTAIPLILRRDYSRATALAQELCALADEKDAPPWRVNGSLNQGVLFALTGKPPNAIDLITSGITALRPTGVTLGMPWWLLHLAMAHADLGELDDAWRCIGEAISTTEATKERWCEAEINRIDRRNRAEVARAGCQRKRKHISSAHSPSPVNNKLNPGNSAPP